MEWPKYIPGVGTPRSSGSDLCGISNQHKCMVLLCSGKTEDRDHEASEVLWARVPLSEEEYGGEAFDG